MANSVYYIVTPRYSTQSAGVRVLHLLCHMINKVGGKAFIVYTPTNFPWPSRKYLNPNLNTRLLTKKDIETHRKSGINPVVIYPEIIIGNPFRANLVVRYLLNFIGLLGGPKEYPKSDFVVSYSKDIHINYPKSQGILFIPSLNSENFWFSGTEMRDITCFYASKFQHLGGSLFGIPKDCIEITRSKSDSPTQKEVGALLRRAKVLYVFENTHLIYEAIMCGCPVVLMYNEHFKEVIGSEYLSLKGVAAEDSLMALDIARKEIPEAIKGYKKLEFTTQLQLKEFLAVIEKFKLHNEERFTFKHPLYSLLKWPYVALFILPKGILNRIKNKIWK